MLVAPTAYTHTHTHILEHTLTERETVAELNFQAKIPFATPA